MPPLAEQRRIVAKVDELNAALSPVPLSGASLMESARGFAIPPNAGLTGRRPNLITVVPPRAAGEISELMAVLDALESTLTTARTTSESLLAAMIARLHAA